MLKALSRLLSAQGYSTRAFGSAQEFMDNYEPGAAGCLLLDLSMPGINGWDLQRWLADSSQPLPILFLTASDDFPEGDRTTGRAVDVLMKPVIASVLIAGIEAALARDREGRNGSGI